MTNNLPIKQRVTFDYRLVVLRDKQAGRFINVSIRRVYYTSFKKTEIASIEASPVELFSKDNQGLAQLSAAVFDAIDHEQGVLTLYE